MIERRQVAERQRVKGNAFFTAGRFSEAYQSYVGGLECQRHDMVLHANAAVASLRMGCPVQAIEHCDKVWAVLPAARELSSQRDRLRRKFSVLPGTR